MRTDHAADNTAGRAVDDMAQKAGETIVDEAEPLGAPSRKAYLGLAVFAIALLLLPIVAGHAGDSWVRILDFALLYIMLALGLNIVVGFAGLLDLGYIAFYAIGAYLCALLASPQFATVLQSFVDNYPELGNWMVGVFGPQIAHNGIHLPVWVIVPLAAALAATFGVILGAPTLKLRGDYLAIVTLGFGEIIRIFLNNLNSPVNFTNGPQGILNIEPKLIGDVSFRQPIALFGFEVSVVQLYYYLFLALVIVFFSIRLQNSRVGRAWVAIREDEIAAKAMGINTRNIKLLAFAMGASFGGVSGAMFASFQGFVSPESFGLLESIVVLAMVVLGGMGHIPGVILGGVLLAAFPEVLRHIVVPIQQTLFGHVIVDAEIIRQLLYGLAMVGIMLFRPAGLWPAPEHGKGLGGIQSKRSAAEGA